MNINIRIIIILNSILTVLLLLCLLPMPYGFYQLVRFCVMTVFIILCFYEYKNGNQMLSIIFGCLVLLFQPFFKITLGRAIWNMVDVIVAVGIVIYTVQIYKKLDKSIKY